MGGNLSLVAEFPDREPVVLTGIAEEGARSKPMRRRHATAQCRRGARTLACCVGTVGDACPPRARGVE